MHERDRQRQSMGEGTKFQFGLPAAGVAQFSLLSLRVISGEAEGEEGPGLKCSSSTT
jgi:hypothetical protein